MNFIDNVTIVIVSHKSKKKLINLIKDISNDIKIIIVENSLDKSIEIELSKLGKKIEIIFSENNGYGSAINLARTHVTTKYFFVLNPDMQKIDDKLIKVFYESAKELNDNFGALGPRFENVSEKSHKQSNINEKYGLIESISGSAMFFCSEVFDKNRGFDENFFLYFEDDDLCIKSKKAGFENILVYDAVIDHIAGGSIGPPNIQNQWEKFSNMSFSRCYIEKKYFGKLKAFKISTLIIFRSILKFVGHILIFKIKKVLRDLAHLYGALVYLLGNK